tara:strand:- start:2808 stop:2978 length:171 start_codon:yes stop_codon:yes gene_type:complete
MKNNTQTNHDALIEQLRAQVTQVDVLRTATEQKEAEIMATLKMMKACNVEVDMLDI